MKNDFISIEQNQNLTLECLVVSRPLASVSWFKSGEKLADNHIIHTRINQSTLISRYQFQVRCRLNILFYLEQTELFSFLLFVDVQIQNEDDFGQYTCIATNKHGAAEGLTFVLRKLKMR